MVVKLGDAALVSAWEKLILDPVQSQTPEPQVVLRMSFLNHTALDGAMCVREQTPRLWIQLQFILPFVLKSKLYYSTYLFQDLREG